MQKKEKKKAKKGMGITRSVDRRNKKRGRRQVRFRRRSGR